MNADVLTQRTKTYSITIGHFIESLASNVINRNYSNQLVRCSSSVGANYRAACRAKSTADFINKLKIVEEELDETMFFLELLSEFNKVKLNEIQFMLREGNEMLSIIVATIVSVRKRQLK